MVASVACRNMTPPPKKFLSPQLDDSTGDRPPSPHSSSMSAPPVPPPSGHVSFRVHERSARVALWLNQNFLTGEELEAEEATGELAVQFTSLRNKGEELHIHMAQVRIRQQEQEQQQ